MHARIFALFLITVAVCFPFALWLIWGLYGARWFSSLYPDDLARLAQTGDLFGGVNALFAAFAFAGVAVAAYFQYGTNKLQKQALTIASTEPLLFHLLELHGEKYENLRINATNRQNLTLGLQGPSRPDEIACIFRERTARDDFLNLVGKIPSGGFPVDDFEEALDIFEQLYLENEDQFGPYYRVFYHVFNLIDQSGLTDLEKVRYANIARSTVNKDELLLLMLNCSRPRGKGFKRLVERYGLLKHISTDEKNNFLDQALAASLFDQTARGDAEDTKD